MSMESPASIPTPHTLIAGSDGSWAIRSIRPVVGASLPRAPRLQFLQGQGPIPPSAVWALSGVTSHVRYMTEHEQRAVSRVQAALGRPEATCAALIPIRKSPEWWALAQDQRREIMQERSRHFAVGMEYLPAIARRLIHCRDYGGEFDFLTWFEYAPEHEAAFEELVDRLRATPEWAYVDREVDVRMTR